MDHKVHVFVDQNFDHFLDSIFGRFGVVLGRHVGVILEPFGGQDRPRSVQNASCKLINIKNVKIHQTLRLPIPQRFLRPQDGAQNAPRSAQDGSKRVLKGNFFALENRLKFGRVLGAILVDFGAQNGAQKPDGVMQNRFFWGSKMLFIFVLFWVASKTAQEGPKGAQDTPGSPPECLKMTQEVPKSTPGGSKRASRDPKSRSRGLETGTVFGQFKKFQS